MQNMRNIVSLYCLQDNISAQIKILRIPIFLHTTAAYKEHRHGENTHRVESLDNIRRKYVSIWVCRHIGTKRVVLGF